VQFLKINVVFVYELEMMMLHYTNLTEFQMIYCHCQFILTSQHSLSIVELGTLRQSCYLGHREKRTVEKENSSTQSRQLSTLSQK